MEVIFSIVGSLAAKAAEYTVDPTARQLSYLFKPRTKFLNLRSKVQDLKDARERLQQSVDSATRKGEVIFDDVQRWLTVANEKISEEDEEKAMKRCFAGFCPDFKSSYQLSKKADKEANSIAQLLTQKDNFDGVSYPSHPKGVDIIRPVKEYEAFGSRNGAFDRVMAALEDDAVSIIGVYGMGGVGKTTLVKEAAKQAKEKQLFTEVVLVSIKQKPNMLNIQKEIAEKLGMTLSEDNLDVRAARLCERLKAKRILVVLDDIWESLELEALGISSGDEHKGCKMLMTSRRLDVLESLNSQPNISIETLKQDEAWTLFKKMAGLVEGSDFQSTAVEVAKRCAGLPIAIATIAKALKPKKNLFEWKDALQQLSQPSERNFKGIPKDAYLAIELSYTFLDAEELGPIFLLCSIMGHDADPEDLLRYAIGLGFIHGLNDMEARRNRILTSVNNLKASCLLLEGSWSNRFDMHDVVRDVAQSIASRDLHWLALTKEWPDEEKMKASQLISLQNVEDSELLNHELECPNLDYFSVGLERSSSLKISENFFKGTQRLKVLEFGRTNFRALPSSIGCLKTLCTLRLRGCDFEDIGILGELGNLEILDLSRSTMKMLPKEIGQLTRLKLLDLSVCDDLKVISPNVLSKLSRLEELYLYDSFDGWEVEGIENPRRNSSLVELQHLPLTTLEVHIPDVEVIPKDNLFLGKMERFKISIGDEKWDWYGDRGMETSRMLKLEMNKSIHLVDGIQLLLGKTQSLYLYVLEDVGEMQMLCLANVESFGQLKFMNVKNCNMLKNLFSFSIAKTLCQLEELEVSDCENITELIAENEEIDENDILEFNKLRILNFENLQSFNGLLYSENTPQSSPWLFDKKVSCPALEELTVKNCHKLKYVFTPSMVKSFVSLKRIWLSKCPEMEGVIEGILEATEEGISSSIRVFPKLDYLDLHTLPKLREFCCGINPIEFPSLRRLEIKNCHDLKTFVFYDVKSRVASSHCLFNEKVIFPVLQQLRIAKMDKLKRLWPDLLVEHSFSKLISIVLSSCPKLLNVFPFSMLTRLQRLHRLSISYCHSVEELISESVPQEGGSSSAMPSLSPQFIQSDVITFEFPALTYLELNAMLNLRSIHHNKMHTINWPSLKKMEVRRCRAVEILFASGETSSEQPLFWVNEVSYSVLEELEVDECYKLKYVFTSSSVKSFVQLKTLKVSDCDKLLNVFPLSMLTMLQRLHTLLIERCESVEEIIYECGPQEGGSSSPQFIQSDVISFEFPALTSLELSGLRNLKSVHHNKMHTINWPSLQEMEVKECSKLETLFASGETSSEQPMFWVNEVSYPVLEKLEVKECRKLKYVFTSSSVKSFVQLKTLKVSECDEMEGVIEGTLAATEDERTSGIIRVFPKLDSLQLEWLLKLRRFCCGINPIEFLSLKRLSILECCYLNTFVFDDGKNIVTPPHYFFNEKVILPMLEELKIRGMDNLERLWPDLLVEHSFSRLTSIELRSCDKLLNVFPLSMLTRLQRLHTLLIKSCESVEEIIYEYGPQEGGSSSPQFIQSDVISFEFPALTSLELFDMPNLRSIHHNKMHTINWPSLEEMRVNKCCAVEILFASGETSSEQPLFWVNEGLVQSTFPSLYQLTLESNAGMKEMIWHCQGQQQHQLLSPYFPNLKVVRLWGYPKQVTVLPSYLFHLLSLPTLQTLEISHSFFKEMIFQSEEGGEEKPASLLLSQITELRLFYLTELMHLWKEKEGFPNLWFLYVEGCSGLKANLVPSSASFRNLVNFKVSKCHGIVKLITHSTAKSLVQLKQMSIKSCKNIEEIIQGEDDDDEISFPHLNRLELEYLPKLEIFCSSEKYTFKFRSLEYLKVYNCPNMKMFSRGVAHTPLLHKVRYNKYGSEVPCKGSLNSTIQELFREKHTIWTSTYSEESENYEEECETKEDQDNPSTSNTQAITEIAGDDTTR